MTFKLKYYNSLKFIGYLLNDNFINIEISFSCDNSFIKLIEDKPVFGTQIIH